MSIGYICVTDTVYRISDVGNKVRPPYPAFQDDTVFLLKIFFPNTLLLWTTLWLVKFALLLQCHRLIDRRPHYLATWWIIVAFTSLFYIGCVVTEFTSCRSLRAWFTFGEPDSLRKTSYRLSSRTFHTTPTRAGSSFFDLTRLSASRESQHLSKEKGRPRTDFAPHLELIKSSEVAPYATKRDKVRKSEDKTLGQTAGLNGQPTQKETDSNTREQQALAYLINEALKTEVDLKSLPTKDAQEQLDALNQNPILRRLRRPTASTLPMAEKHTPEEIDRAAAESPKVAYMNAELVRWKQPLKKAVKSDPILAAESMNVGEPNSKTQANDKATTNMLIASLIKELQATRHTLEAKPAADRSFRILTTWELFALAILIFLCGIVWDSSSLPPFWVNTQNNASSTSPHGHLSVGAVTPQAGISLDNEDEREDSRRSVESLLYAESQQAEEVYSEEVPVSRWKKWFWA
ncbi:MAG: hypothetical protein Q9171_004494 [Xanthocarpia ochracea]